MEDVSKLVENVRGLSTQDVRRQRAFGELVRRFQDMAFGCAYAMLGDFQLAEETAQDAFLIAYQRLEALQDADAFPGWLKQIVIRQCHRHTRKKQTPTAIPIEDMPEVAGDSDSSLDVETQETRTLIRDAVQSLPESQRMVTSLFYLADFNATEIAQLLDISSSTVRKRLQYARRAMKEQVIGTMKEMFDDQRPSRNTSFTDQVLKKVEIINQWADRFQSVPQTEFPDITDSFRKRIASGTSLDELLPEAYGLVKEVCHRMEGQTWESDGKSLKWTATPEDNELIGSIMIHEGKIAETASVEENIIMAILPPYLHALTGRGVHITSTKHEVAEMYCKWAAPLFEMLGLTVSCLDHTDRDVDRKKQRYKADIVFGAVSEFGFDYLRDGLKDRSEDQVMPDYHSIILDDTWKIMVDDARTPLIIAQRDYTLDEVYIQCQPVVKKLVQEQQETGIAYFTTDEHREVQLTEAGHAFIAKDVDGAHWDVIKQLIRAYVFYTRDEEYVVEDGRVYYRDLVSGEIWRGREFSDGLQQALEAKEGVELRGASVTLATITIQDYLGLYEKLAGLIGPVDQESREALGERDLEVVVIDGLTD